MNPILKNLSLAAAVLTMTVTLASVAPNSAALAQTTAPSATASLPAATVKALQEALNKQGIAVKADGVFGDDTRAAIRQYQSQHHLPVTGEPDKATLDKLGVAGQRGDLPTGSPSAGAAMPGQAMGGAGMGGQGMMGMMTPEMMQRMMAHGGMSGMMGGMGANMTAGPAMLYGAPRGAQEEMTPERVRTLLQQRLTQHGNPRIKIGEIATAADGSITAEIVTVDGSLVQKLAFNRYPGLVRQLP